jgi:hypothetical protein
MDESMWRTVTERSSYPTELDAHLTLTDQRRIRIRALHSHEEGPIRLLHERLSPRTQDEPVGGCFRLAKSLGRSR